MTADWIGEVEKRLPVGETRVRVHQEKLWAKTELILGVQIPQDYKDFEQHWGAGGLGDYVHFFHPFLPRNGRFHQMVAGYIEDYVEIKVEFPEDHPLPIFPKTGSFLPFAWADVDAIGWQVSEQPSDTWPVVINGRDEPELLIIANSFADFMLNLTRNELNHIELITCFWNEDTQFQPLKIGQS